jgi:hypothetical protein
MGCWMDAARAAAVNVARLVVSNCCCVTAAVIALVNADATTAARC